MPVADVEARRARQRDQKRAARAAAPPAATATATDGTIAALETLREVLALQAEAIRALAEALRAHAPNHPVLASLGETGETSPRVSPRLPDVSPTGLDAVLTPPARAPAVSESSSLSAVSENSSAAAASHSETARGETGETSPRVSPRLPDTREPPPPPPPVVERTIEIETDPLEEVYRSAAPTSDHASVLAQQLRTLETSCGRPSTITLEEIAREVIAEIGIAGPKIRDVVPYAGRIARPLFRPGALAAKRAAREAAASAPRASSTPARPGALTTAQIDRLAPRKTVLY